MEVGSFIELQFRKGLEYYKGDDIARLNSGRAAIYHAVRCFYSQTVWLPYYECDTVRDFLIEKGLRVKYYYIDKEFTPMIDSISNEESIVIVNYFGIMSYSRMTDLAARYNHVIIDNAQAFFAEPLESCMNVYSARKFIGVPDGAYVVGSNCNQFLDGYEQDYSSDTSLFLLQRIEYGCEGKAYQSRMINEQRINDSDVKKMSKLTHGILDGTDYEVIKIKRRENFNEANRLFQSINLINPLKDYDDSCFPMVYPLVVEDDSLIDRLQKAKHFQGHWWSYLLNEVKEGSFEYWISRFIVPITIDQRYSIQDIDNLYSEVIL